MERVIREWKSSEKILEPEKDKERDSDERKQPQEDPKNMLKKKRNLRMSSS